MTVLLPCYVLNLLPSGGKLFKLSHSLGLILLFSYLFMFSRKYTSPLATDVHYTSLNA